MKNKGFARQNFHKKISGGFTLIELLVVIAVIGILASVVLASLNSARGKARNAKRLSDIKQIVTALNLGLDFTFPAGGWFCMSETCYGAWANGLYRSTALDNYLAPYLKPPIDPDDGGKRGYGGYLYANPAGPYTSLYDGVTTAQGAYLNWNMEPPVSTGICGPGRIYNVSSNHVQCLYRFDDKL